jgi:hypothetical protein
MCSKVDRRTMKLADCVPIIIHNDKVDFITAGATNYIKLLETRKTEQDLAAKEAQSKRELEDAVEKKKKDDDNVAKAGKEKEKGLKGKRTTANTIIKGQIVVMRSSVIDILKIFMQANTKKGADITPLNNLIKFMETNNTKIVKGNNKSTTQTLTTQKMPDTLKSEIFKALGTYNESGQTISEARIKAITEYASKLVQASTKLTVDIKPDVSDETLIEKLNQVIELVNPSTVATVDYAPATDASPDIDNGITEKYNAILTAFDKISETIEQYNDLGASSDTEE